MNKPNRNDELCKSCGANWTQIESCGCGQSSIEKLESENTKLKAQRMDDAATIKGLLNTLAKERDAFGKKETELLGTTGFCVQCETYAREIEEYVEQDVKSKARYREALIECFTVLSSYQHEIGLYKQHPLYVIGTKEAIAKAKAALEGKD